MLSVGRIQNRDYLINLATDDYYEIGGEPPGKWHGQGAEFLGLKYPVNKQDLHNLMDGFLPSDRQIKLVQNAGSQTREIGWDFTFSAPKTVSVLWSQARLAERNAIERIQESAVRTTLDWLESRATTRRGKGGVRREPVTLVTALFEHGTSRAVDGIPDPNLHTHVVLLNLGIRQDGTQGALQISELLKQKMLVGAFYRAELAKQLREQLGYQAGKHLAGKPELFDVTGVDSRLVQLFSKRRQQITEQLQTKGLESAIAAAVATLDTRREKTSVNRQELFSVWQRIGKGVNYQPPAPNFKHRDLEPTQEQLGTDALNRLLEQSSSFTEDELLHQLALSAPQKGLGIEEIQSGVQQILARNDLVCLGEMGGNTRYTTRAIHQRANEWIQALEQGQTSLEWASAQWPNQSPGRAIEQRSSIQNGQLRL